MIAYETRLGKIDITEAYLSKLIGHEVTSCFGVVGMIPSNSRQRQKEPIPEFALRAMPKRFRLSCISL